MTRPQLEHILRAAGAISGAPEFVVIGSQALLGAVPEPPPELASSMEVDLFSLRSPDDAQLVEGSIGELSPFHRTFGYHAHAVGEDTAILPSGWRARLIRLASSAPGGATGLCLEPHDLAVSKLAAGREKDLAFVGAMIRHRIVQPGTLRERLAAAPLTGEHGSITAARLDRLLNSASGSPG